MLDYLITASLWVGLAYLAVGFTAYAIQRSSNAVPISQPTEPETIAPQVTTDPVAEAIGQIEAAYKGIDTVVPFHRPAKLEPTDAELIRFAKSIKFPGSGKWAKTRKLSAKVRAQLLQQMRQSA
jgi:hypothetical protein